MEELKSIRSTGKSVDEAIFKGLQEMEISIDEVSIEIIQTETKGILGIGAKPAIVLLTQRPPEEYEIPDYMKRREDRDRNRVRNDRRQDKSDRDRRNKERVRPERKPEAEEKPAEAPAAEEKEPAPEAEKPAAPRENRPARQPKRPEKEEAPAEEKEPAPEKVINYTLEAAEGNPAAEFVQGLIEHMGAEGKVLAARDEDCLRLRIDSEMMGMLIGHRGETLDAMQYLTGLVVNKNRKVEGYTRVTLDTEEYREKREETLRRLARKVAGQVRATGRPRALEPMNPYERRVLHSALQNNPDVTTHSEGEEPNRRVVITPRRRNGYKGRPARRVRGGKKPYESVADMENNVEPVVENIENSAEN
ncbi:MAG: Jag N-terminal domain-containing protein [Clostridia bacterium]|nr:Jag N-terminal domain-containing protein [Clostridia bacterium]